MGRPKGSKDGVYTTLEIFCNFCGNKFLVVPYRKDIAKYCCRQCKDKSRIGKKASLETRKKLSIYHKSHPHKRWFQKGMTSYNKGKHLSFETKKKISGRPNYDGKMRTTEGYVLVYSPHHPLKNCNDYVLEHRLVMEKHIGRYLRPEEIVHHINGIVDDNQISNLQMFNNWKSHIRFHKINDGIWKA